MKTGRLVLGACTVSSGAALAGPPCEIGWQPEIGVPGTSQVVRSMIVFDDGSGPALYIGGPFTTAGGVTVNSIARWDGAAFSALGSGVGGPTPTAAAVNGLAVHDDGSGSALYALGSLITAGGQPASRIAKWDGSAWSALGSGLNQASQSAATFNDGTGNALYVGGAFSQAGGVPNTAGIARWKNAQWSEVGGGVAGSCNVLIVYDDGTGSALYAGGTFFAAGGIAGTSRVARWNGTAWSELAGGMDGPNNPRVNHMIAFDAGAGTRLFAGGFFSTAGGSAADNLASWNGTAWAPVGVGTDNTVIRMATFDSGTGPGLYVGGAFFTVGGASPVNVNQIARWDGETWTGLDGGVTHPMITTVSALAAHDDGSGPSLFVAGGFTTAGSVPQPANNIVRWGCPACYPDCNGDSALTISDFGCFQTAFVAQDPYADCNGDLVFAISDFGCFQTRFVQGCP